jgi:GNAT superfamily N-acetyltransferase
MMTDDQITQTFNMIVLAAQSGQGFGVGEYDDEADFRQDIANGYRFAIMESDSDEMVAAFILNESRYTRGCRVADPYIIVRSDQRGRGLGRLCMELALKFAPCLGFIGMYADTFANNSAMIRIIQSIQGFRKVGDLPMGGVMASGEVVGSVVFYKDLRHVTADVSNEIDVNNNSTDTVVRKSTSQTG